MVLFNSWKRASLHRIAFSDNVCWKIDFSRYSTPYTLFTWPQVHQSHPQFWLYIALPPGFSFTSVKTATFPFSLSHPSILTSVVAFLVMILIPPWSWLLFFCPCPAILHYVLSKHSTKFNSPDLFHPWTCSLWFDKEKKGRRRLKLMHSEKKGISLLKLKK